MEIEEKERENTRYNLKEDIQSRKVTIEPTGVPKGENNNNNNKMEGRIEPYKQQNKKFKTRVKNKDSAPHYFLMKF